MGPSWIRGTACALLLLAGGTSESLAWGPEGHVVIAIVAEHRMSDEARTAVRAMLSGAPLAAAALSADQFRPTPPETARWHRVGIPFDARSYDPARDCAALPAGDCVIEAITRASDVILDSDAQPLDRADAIRWTVHLMGDLHQPFNAIERNGDGGGKAVDVWFFDERTTLHALWDDGLIRHTGLTAEEYAEHLERDIIPTLDAGTVRAGDTDRWALDSHDVARGAYVDDEARLGQAYVDAQVPVLDRQLALAAMRLAAHLEWVALVD